MTLTLRELTSKDESAFLEGASHWPTAKDLALYAFDWNKDEPFAELLNRIAEQKLGRNLPNGFVSGTRLYAFDKTGNIIGRLYIRHSLNDHLEKRGGHIGYAVAEKYRNQGYATQMLRQGLEYCKNLNFRKVLLTCSDTNVPSWKVIERQRGKLENKIYDDATQETIRRYWIEIG